MLSGIATLQGLVLLLLGLLALILAVYSLIDALRHRPEVYKAAGKQSRGLWLTLLGVAAAIAFVSLTGPLGLLNILGVVASGVYLADVRPALRGMDGGRGGGRPRDTFRGW